MEKFYIVTDESPLRKQYLDYWEAAKAMSRVFNDFAARNGIEASRFYTYVDSLRIIPTARDEARFCTQLKNSDLGCFKKNSAISKAWVSECAELGLKSIAEPLVQFYFRHRNAGRYTIFEVNEVVYVRYLADSDFDNPAGFREIKGSEFYKVVEDYNNGGRD